MKVENEYLGETDRDGVNIHVFERTKHPDALTTETIEVGITASTMETIAADLLTREKKPFQTWEYILDNAVYVDETVTERETDSLINGTPELEFAGGSTGSKDMYGIGSFEFTHAVSVVGAELNDNSVYVQVTAPDGVTVRNVSGSVNCDHPAQPATDSNTRTWNVHLPFEQASTYNLTFKYEVITHITEQQEINVTWFIDCEEQFSKSLTINPV